MYVSINQEISRQHREEIVRGVAAARLTRTALTNGETTSRPMRNLGWELSRYAGLFGKRLRK